MNREMRVAKRAIGQDEIMEVLGTAEYGILSTISEDDTPYGTPLNFAYDDGVLYFHCASEGHKLDNIRYNSNGCFTIVDSVELLASKFSTKYRSVVAFGKVQVVEDPEEKKQGLIKIVEKLSPDFVENGIKYINGAFDRVTVLRMDIEHMTGKSHKERL